MISKKDKVILVTGATGHQGGAVVDSLLKNGWGVRALTRKTSGDAIDSLSKKGVEIVTGNLEDRSSLDRALKGVYGAFLVTTFWESGVNGEIRMGKRFGDAAKSAGVEHLIFSSVGAADKNTLIPHFESKREIELYLKDIGLPLTIYRPVAFMMNFEMPQSRDSILSGVFRSYYPEKKKVQLLALEDLGAFVNIAFENPEDYLRKAIEIASDELTGTDICRDFSRVLGQKIRYEQTPLEEVRKQSEDMFKMAKWGMDKGFGADMKMLKKIYPKLTSFGKFLDLHGWARMRGSKAA